MLKFLYKNIYSLWINRVKPIKAFKAIRALDKNKEDTTQVFHVIDALKGASDKKYFKIFSNSIVGKKILDRKIQLVDTLKDKEFLKNLPKETLGYKYYEFIYEENLSPEELIDATHGKLKAVTIAPEMEGSEAFIKRLKKDNVSIHLGHSGANPKDVPMFADWGVDAVTHMYDALPTYPADDTGVHVLSLTDALIAESRIALGLICDGIHVHPQLVELLSHLPSDRVFLETDSVKGSGSPVPIKFEFYPGRWCTVEKGKASTYDGLLAGSSLTSIEGLQNYLKYSKKTISQVSIAASLVPARVIGLDDKMGSIEKNKLADFILLRKNDLEIAETFIAGKSVYKSD